MVTLYPDEETGHPSVEALKAAVSKRTAGIFVTNPEDTGIFNRDIDEWTRIVHEVGGLCAYDQANLNAVMGVTRARDAGFDMSFFNLHKTFSSPQAASGPGRGALGVTGVRGAAPHPRHREEGRSSTSTTTARRASGGCATSSATCRSSSAPTLGRRRWALRGCRRRQHDLTTTTSREMMEVPGVSKPYGGEAAGPGAVEPREAEEGDGLRHHDVQRRIIDYGVQSFFTSHHPLIVRSRSHRSHARPTRRRTSTTGPSSNASARRLTRTRRYSRARRTTRRYTRSTTSRCWT